MSAYSATQIARKNGYRSGLEDTVATTLKGNNTSFIYEKLKFEWEDLAYRTYTPDFVLFNGIIIETKGRFIASDRRKHIEIKRQHPKIDIRFIFTNSKTKLRKGAKSNYAEWCIKHGFRYSDLTIPEDWLKEKPKKLVWKCGHTIHFIPFKGKKRKRGK